VVVKDGAIIAEGVNRVTAKRSNCSRRNFRDPRGLRQAGRIRAQRLRSLHFLRTLPHVFGGNLLGPPGARLLCGSLAADAARVGFDDAFIYREIAQPHARRKIPMIQMMRDEALAAFRRLGKETQQDRILSSSRHFLPTCHGFANQRQQKIRRRDRRATPAPSRILTRS
jgi:guanine deaminase